MMKKNSLMSVMVMAAMLGSATVLAEALETQTGNPGNPNIGNLDNKDNKMTSWLKGRNDARNIEAMLIGSGTSAKVTIDNRTTARGMIGEEVYDQEGNRIATVRDIIVDNEGRARLVVVRDAKWMDFNRRLAAFDYGAIMNITAEGDVAMPITARSFDSLVPFSYDADDAQNGSVNIMPANSYSVQALLDGNLVDPEGKRVADIDNVAFRNGRAALVMAGYNQILNMGGDMAAVELIPQGLTRKAGSVDVRLTAQQAAEFRNLKKSS
jgi:sporulation protein YlmC with PRC-barrel domain